MLWWVGGMLSGALAGVPTAQVIFVVDASHSWSEMDFVDAREALVAGLVELDARTDVEVEVGLVVFGNRFGWVYTELQPLTPNRVDIWRSWRRLARLSNAGFDADASDGIDCARHYVYDPPNADNFQNPPGGCYPNMPRKYADETGTDHSNGLRAAYGMFAAAPAADIRVTLMLTDGLPSPIPANVGNARFSEGYVSPFPMFVGPRGMLAAHVRASAEAESVRLWQNLRVHQWVVSYREQDPWLSTMVQGQGVFLQTTDPTELTTFLVDIASP